LLALCFWISCNCLHSILSINTKGRRHSLKASVFRMIPFAKKEHHSGSLLRLPLRKLCRSAMLSQATRRLLRCYWWMLFDGSPNLQCYEDEIRLRNIRLRNEVRRRGRVQVLEKAVNLKSGGSIVSYHHMGCEMLLLGSNKFSLELSHHDKSITLIIWYGRVCR
jgi:hypothetical protein